MKRILLAATLVTAIAGGGIVAAQTASPTADDHAAHHPGSKSPAAPAAQPGDNQPAGMGGGMMGGGMMGGGMCPMMGGGMMGGGMGPMMGAGMMGGAKTKVDVKKVDKGVSITMTSGDPATAARLQKMAEAMKLMHEAMTQ